MSSTHSHPLKIPLNKECRSVEHNVNKQTNKQEMGHVCVFSVYLEWHHYGMSGKSHYSQQWQHIALLTRFQLPACLSLSPWVVVFCQQPKDSWQELTSWLRLSLMWIPGLGCTGAISAGTTCPFRERCKAFSDSHTFRIITVITKHSHLQTVYMQCQYW